ncbi:Protein CHROMATIN REMODELING 25 [Camellia lanceoleosa]|uniref:Protein CHROMATIN REMODELING 25 n=1 Tax=Camellia lanceoleosa TaxID=1840588 RepID=A0ACC0FHM3_9ERIC|nr:Protein CHROMATIN REMODELING 25 [Camellia lanceoleosa]
MQDPFERERSTVQRDWFGNSNTRRFETGSTAQRFDGDTASSLLFGLEKISDTGPFCSIVSERRYLFLRLDGTTSISKRKKFVNRFNDRSKRF